MHFSSFMLQVKKKKNRELARERRPLEGWPSSRSPEAREQRAGIDNKRNGIILGDKPIKGKYWRKETRRPTRSKTSFLFALHHSNRSKANERMSFIIRHHHPSIWHIFLLSFIFLQESARDITKGFVLSGSSTSWNETPFNLLGANKSKYCLESSSGRGFCSGGTLKGREMTTSAANKPSQAKPQSTPCRRHEFSTGMRTCGKTKRLRRYFVTDRCSSGTGCTPCLFIFFCLTTQWNDTGAKLQSRVSICDLMLLSPWQKTQFIDLSVHGTLRCELLPTGHSVDTVHRQQLHGPPGVFRSTVVCECETPTKCQKKY